MWPFKKKKIKHRRLEVRKDISSDVPSLWERFRTTGMMVSVLLGLGFWISAGLLDICPLDPLPYRQGQYLPGNVRARVAFEVPSPTRMEDQLRLAREATPATFVLDERRINAIVSSVQSLPGKLKTTTQPSSLEKELRESFALDDTTLAAWKAMFEELHRDKLNAITKSLKTDLTKLAVVSGDQAEQQMSRHTGGVILKGSDWSRLIEKSELIAQDDEVRVSAAAERLAKGATEGVLADSLKVFLSRQLTTNPLYSYDSEVTEADIALREKETRDNPPLAAKDRYEPGQILVERTVSSGRAGAPLEARELELLAHEHRAWLNEGSTAGLWARAIGRMIQILMVTVLLSVYIAKYQGRIVSNHLRGLAVVIVLLLMLAMSRIMGSLLDWNPYASVLTVVMISCVMAITYNQRFAMAIGSVQAVLVTMQLRGDFGMLIVMLSGVMPCVFLLRDIRTRSKLIEVSAISAAVVFLAVWVRSWTGQAPWNFAMVDGLWASGFALLAGFLVQGILPLIERAFKVATSMTLLEWCDASKPLLKRLATQAPGTYNH
ncbi:MAG: hypothetical protein GY794_03505, partial [bacterium]|nr:hypothetical protein [bacterium]